MSLKDIFWSSFTTLDGKLKFPHLKKDEIGIQLGFDMVYPITSDLFTMHKRVAQKGQVIGIDPDPFNHKIASKIIHKEQLNIQLIQKGTYSKKDSVQFLLGKKSSWNQLKIVPKDTGVDFTDKEITVEINTLDSILEKSDIDIQKIGHINLTINGAEYDTLLGMKNILTNCKNLSLTIIAGRYDESGTIDGQKDFELILPLLHSFGFTTKFKRINELFWWGFIVKTIVNRKWIYSQNNFGVIMAGKGNKKPKWYQSFS
ncbi:MAG: FkbM family methyltransferase [Flavobacteriales bacterium]|nr:FkbM family methyltransferase [Flavobacteriales bacterium]